MSSGIVKLRKEFEDIYGELTQKYVGYIQMSDKYIEHIHKKPNDLWALAELYKDVKGNSTEVNYVLEMALFCEETKESILVRQHNDGWLLRKKNIEESMPIESFHTVASKTLKMKMAQIWEDTPNDFCNVWYVSELQCLMFAGFETTGGQP